MIVQNFSRPPKQVRIDTSYFCLMLVVAVPQFLFLIWDFILLLMLLALFKNRLGFKSLKKNPRAGQETGSCMPPMLEMSYHYL